MTRPSDEDTMRLLREALSPPRITSPNPDLWPRVRRKVQHGSPAPTLTDWILMAAVAVVCLWQPSAVLVPLFHF